MLVRSTKSTFAKRNNYLYVDYLFVNYLTYYLAPAEPAPQTYTIQ